MLLAMQNELSSVQVCSGFDILYRGGLLAAGTQNITSAAFDKLPADSDKLIACSGELTTGSDNLYISPIQLNVDRPLVQVRVHTSVLKTE